MRRFNAFKNINMFCDYLTHSSLQGTEKKFFFNNILTVKYVYNEQMRVFVITDQFLKIFM